MIEFVTRDGVAVLTLAHGKANALDLELCLGLAERLDGFGASSSRALVITGRGSIFSAGVDLPRLLNEGPGYVEKFLPAMSDLFEKLFLLPKPVICAVNGHAIAGGCILACAADHRTMARGAGRVGVPELRVGVPFPCAALEIMRHALAPGFFQEVMYRGAVLEPEAALAWRLIDAIAPQDELLERAVAVARDLASMPPEAFAITKRQMREPASDRMKAGRLKHDPGILDVWKSPGTVEAVRDYVSRTFKRAKT